MDVNFVRIPGLTIMIMFPRDRDHQTSDHSPMSSGQLAWQSGRECPRKRIRQTTDSERYCTFPILTMTKSGINIHAVTLIQLQNTQKDTWHREGLSERVECRAPRDLPRRDIGENESQLQHQFIDLQEDTRTGHHSMMVIHSLSPWSIHKLDSNIQEHYYRIFFEETAFFNLHFH